MDVPKTQSYSLNIKGKGGVKKVSFTTNIDLKHPTHRKNWLSLVGAIYARPEPEGTYDTNTQLSSLLQIHLVSSLEQGDS